MQQHHNAWNRAPHSLTSFPSEGYHAASGAVAQLGEHRLCKAGVWGSSPHSSTLFPLWYAPKVSSQTGHFGGGFRVLV